MFLKSVINFYKRLVKDRVWRELLNTANDLEEFNKMLQEAGYNFTQAELETATVELLEKKNIKDLEDHLTDLTEEDLQLAFGGISKYRWWPIEKEPIIQPLYGVVVVQPPDEEPIDPIYITDPPEAIAMYGVVVSDTEFNISQEDQL